MFRLRAMLWPTTCATLAAALSASIYIVVDALVRGLPLVQMTLESSVPQYFVGWSLLAGLFASLCSVVPVGRFNAFWTFALAGFVPLLAAAIATWPPPHLTRICIDDCPNRDEPFEMLWGQQREAWWYYMFPLIKYPVLMVPACIAYFFASAQQMRSNNSLERSRER